MRIEGIPPASADPRFGLGPAEDSRPCNKPGRPLNVVVRDLMDAPSAADALESILQSYCDTASGIIKNMVMTPEERRVLEERREKIKKLLETAKERKLDEQEIRLELDRLLPKEDKQMLEAAISSQILYS